MCVHVCVRDESVGVYVSECVCVCVYQPNIAILRPLPQGPKIKIAG